MLKLALNCFLATGKQLKVHVLQMNFLLGCQIVWSDLLVKGDSTWNLSRGGVIEEGCLVEGFGVLYCNKSFEYLMQCNSKITKEFVFLLKLTAVKLPLCNRCCYNATLQLDFKVLKGCKSFTLICSHIQMWLLLLLFLLLFISVVLQEISFLHSIWYK